MEEFVLYVVLALIPIGIGCLIGLVIIAYKNRVRKNVESSSHLPEEIPIGSEVHVAQVPKDIIGAISSVEFCTSGVLGNKYLAYMVKHDGKETAFASSLISKINR